MNKRALIVDDSRSARVILSRMLEGYGLEVDSSESAEHALEFLRQARPDVIFMDHLMPGMDGFQAIQAIKGNPDTATIPVVMYTSQEGELYVSQARALGAVGVLPKTVKHADVSRVLYQLRMLPERREGRAQMEVVEQSGPSAVEIEPIRSQPGEMELAIRRAVGPLLKEHDAEMRRFVLANLDAFARRIGADTKPPAVAPSAAPTNNSEPLPPAVIEPQTIFVRQNRWPLVASVAMIALIPALVLGVLYSRELAVNRALQTSASNLQTTISEQQMQLSKLQESTGPAPVSTGAAADTSDITSELVPYGEAPLAGSRMERLREMLGQLRAKGFRGKVRVATYVGEFCLTGNGIEGYSMAMDDLPVKKCDLVGNPFEDSLPAAQRQSLGFANMIATLRKETDNMLTVEVSHEGRRPNVAYPTADQLARVTAGDWNRIAAQNNRVEFTALPAGS